MATIGQVEFTGSLVSGPPTVSESALPTGSSQTPFNLIDGPKPFGAVSPSQSMTLSSPNAFTALAGVGTTVQAANFFYLRTITPFDVRLTQKNPLGGTTVKTITQAKGIIAIEVDDPNAIVLVEVQGTGTIEWFASGTQ